MEKHATSMFSQPELLCKSVTVSSPWQAVRTSQAVELPYNKAGSHLHPEGWLMAHPLLFNEQGERVIYLMFKHKRIEKNIVLRIHLITPLEKGGRENCMLPRPDFKATSIIWQKSVLDVISWGRTTWNIFLHRALRPRNKHGSSCQT